MMHILGAEKCIIGIENNKTDAEITIVVEESN